MADLPLPDGSVVLHIGPHKTGTTTIQHSLAASRDTLRGHGVVYPGAHAHEMGPAMAVAMGKVDPGKSITEARERWDAMIREIHAPRTRLGVLSSEFFSDTPTERIPELLDLIGADTHVVITLRPLVRLLASQWQQYMQNQMVHDYEHWLQAILERPEPGKMTPTFWQRHRDDLQVRRWLDVVGPDRLTVVIVDQHDPDFLLRAFEQLLDVPEHTLSPVPGGSNRSLSWDEVELVRRFNQEYWAEGYGAADYTRFVRFGAVREMQAAPVTGEKILTPQWAIDRISELGASMADAIAELDVRVMGSLYDLGDPSLAPDPGVNDPAGDVPVELAASLAAGLVTHAGRVRATTDVQRDQGPIEAALRTRHRVVRAVERRDQQEKVAQQKAQAGEGQPPSYSRGEILRELSRRARRRVGKPIRRGR